MATGQDGSSYGNTHVSGGYAVLGDVYNHYTTHQRNLGENPKTKLLKQLYYDTMDSRKTNIHSAAASTCEWIWDTVFASWIRATSPESNVFWICGKPGSGKSTLMKYLTTSPKLKLELPNANWSIIDFFFDFRQKDRLGNTIEGLIRSLLIQIVEKVSIIPPELVDKTERSGNFDLGALRELFNLILQNHTLYLFIMIDGLDEYNGNMRSLLEFLLRHSHQANVRVCLASRPQSVIDVFAGPNRIHMSEHNLNGIQKYLDLAITPFVDPHNKIEWREVRSQIEQRADGVFLWVYLVTDEVLHAFVIGETFSDVMERLEDIPDELDALYQRIFDAIPRDREVEVAIVFELLDKAEVPLNLGQLHGMMLFLNEKYSLKSEIGKVTSKGLFLRRLQSAGGALLHFRKQEPRAINERSVQYKIRFELIEYGSTIVHVSLMHRTVSSFITRSRWGERRRPRCLVEIFSSHVCKRIAAKAVILANLKLHDCVEDILTKIGSNFYSLNDFQSILMEFTKDDYLLAWAPLLHFGILHVVPGCLILLRNEEDEGLAELLEALIRSRLAALHYVFSWAHYDEGDIPPIRHLDSDCADLMIAAEHGRGEYLQDQLERVRALQDSQRDSILVQLMLAADHFHYRCAHAFQDYPVEQSAIRNLISGLLREQQTVTSLHVMLSLFIGDFSAIKTNLNGENLANLSSNPQVLIPEWNRPLRRVLRGKNPLFTWACGILMYTLVEHRITVKQQLQFLLSLGFSINHQDEEATNVCHYLLINHMFGHVLEETDTGSAPDTYCGGGHGIQNDCHFHATLEALTKLYLVEEYGADFEMLHQSRTLLQNFCRARARFLKHLQRKLVIEAEAFNFDILRDLPDLLRSIMVTLDEIEFILRHKSVYGHLPQPMMRKWDLKHYYCGTRTSCHLCEGKGTSAVDTVKARFCDECEIEESSEDEEMD